MNVADFSPTPWPDWYFVVLIFCTQVISLALAYWIGDYIWVERHSVQIHVLGRERISGFWGEVLIALLGATVLVSIEALSPSVNLYRLITGHPTTFWTVLAVCVVLYVIYARSVLAEAQRTEAHRGKKHLRRLAFTYCAYGPYSIALYLGVIACLLPLLLQYVADAAEIANQRAIILDHLHAMVAQARPGAVEAKDVQAGVEIAYGDILINGGKVATSMNPVFLLITVAVSIMFIVQRSPLRKVLLGLPRSMAHYTGIMALVIFFLLTLVSYYTSYADLANQSLAYISGLRPVMERGHDWEITRRFNEIVIDLDHRRTFIGFAATVINESGAAVIWMALLQWITSRNPATEKERKE